MVAGPLRPYLWPAAFLLAATLAVAGWRLTVRGSPSDHQSKHPAAHAVARPPRFYRVHAGDTLASIAARSRVSVAVLRRLNPQASPTALFLGQRLRLP